jgi:polysaccharide export outer membrane protein
MRLQVQAPGDGGRATTAAARSLLLALSLCCALLLTACGASLSNEFKALDAPKAEPSKGETPSRLSVATHGGGDTKPLARVADKLTSGATPGSSGYKIGPLDVIEFSVFKVPELTRTVQVSETGTVNLPLVGEVSAAGRTARDVEHELTKTLGAKYLQSPQVSILIKEYNSQRVTVEGAVRRPGVYPIRGKLSLLQVIATAEGLDSASDTTVVIFRQIEGKRLAAKFDVGQIRSGDSADPPIQSGDVIVAPTSAMKGTFDTILKSLPIATVFALL